MMCCSRQIALAIRATVIPFRPRAHVVQPRSYSRQRYTLRALEGPTGGQAGRNAAFQLDTRPIVHNSPRSYEGAYGRTSVLRMISRYVRCMRDRLNVSESHLHEMSLKVRIPFR